MARYSIINVARSDGRSHYLSNGHPVPNEPPRQDSTPAADGSIDYYQRLQDDDPTSVDWRRKLGGMLMEVIGGPEHAGKNYILGDLPKDYVLWQHRRTRAKDGKAVAETSRQDTYLYGHPHGKGRFRSAQEFFPHLLWLAADREGDALRNCSCKFCHPEGKMMAVLDGSAKSVPVAPKIKPADIRAEAPKMALVAAPQPPNASKAGASQAANKKTAEQMLDSNPSNDFIYRPGELVWFSKGVAWGLSVVLKRNMLDGKRQYLLQPLSHPLAQAAAVVRDRDAIRPWLAWSVPGTTIAQIANLTYDQIPWERVLRGEFGNGDPKVDGSILAAKAVNESYSFFDRVDLPTPAGEVHYKGMFLGGEKIWAGEPVRLMGDTKDEIVIMVVHQMIEKTTDASKSAVTIVGDIYKFVKMPTPASYGDRQSWPANDDLPARVNADLRFRNEVAADAGRNIWCEWRLLEPMARQALADIKGRWYETKLLLPTLRGADAFAADVRAGEVSDVGLFMNARGDILNHGEGVRKKNRLATLGRAVPADVKISRGLDGPPDDNVFPEQV